MSHSITEIIINSANYAINIGISVIFDRQDAVQQYHENTQLSNHTLQASQPQERTTNDVHSQIRSQPQGQSYTDTPSMIAPYTYSNDLSFLGVELSLNCLRNINDILESRNRAGDTFLDSTQLTYLVKTHSQLQNLRQPLAVMFYYNEEQEIMSKTEELLDTVRRQERRQQGLNVRYDWISAKLSDLVSSGSDDLAPASAEATTRSNDNSSLPTTATSSTTFEDIGMTDLSSKMNRLHLDVQPADKAESGNKSSGAEVEADMRFLEHGGDFAPAESVVSANSHMETTGNNSGDSEEGEYETYDSEAGSSEADESETDDFDGIPDWVTVAYIPWSEDNSF